MFTKRYIRREFWTTSVIDIVKAEIMEVAMARARALAVQLLDEEGNLRRQEWIRKDAEYQVRMEKQREFNKAEKKLSDEMYLAFASMNGASGSGASGSGGSDTPPADNAGNADDAGGVGTNVNTTHGNDNQPRWAGQRKWRDDQIVKDQWNGNRKKNWHDSDWWGHTHRNNRQKQ